MDRTDPHAPPNVKPAIEVQSRDRSSSNISFVTSIPWNTSAMSVKAVQTYNP